jgi:predicted component of type VI protein secretion system
LIPVKAELVPENGDPPIPIDRDLTVVGRHENCDVVIANPSLSKRHCVLVKTDGLLVIRDLATTNGTKVKGQRIRWAALLPEDKVSLGAYKIRIYLGSDEMPSPSEQRRARSGAPPVPRPPAGAPDRALSFPDPSPDPDADPGPMAPPAAERLGKKPALVAAHQERAPEPPHPRAATPRGELAADDDEIIDLE